MSGTREREVGSRGNSVRYLDVLRRALLVLGCLIFLDSIILPFVYAPFRVSIFSQTCWSYKAIYRVTGYGERPELWFFDYWTFVHSQSTYTLWDLMLMFAAQILTLTTVIASIFIHKRHLALAPAILSPAVTALMTCASSSFSGQVSYEQGYWLTYPPIFLFLIAFMLHLFTQEPQNTELKNSVSSLIRTVQD